MKIDLYYEIENGIFEFVDKTFDSEINLIFFNSIDSKYLRFIRCTFTDEMEIGSFVQNDLSILFYNCNFEKQIYINHCSIKKLIFNNICELRDLQITDVEIEELIINSKYELENCNIEVTDISISKLLSLSRLKIKKGGLSLTYNFDNTENDKKRRASMINFRCENAYFMGDFGTLIDFRNSKIKTIRFDHCTFQKAVFDKTSFGINSSFFDCKFSSNTSFRDCTNQDKLVFQSCLFESFSHFNESSFNNFKLLHTTFEKKASFDKVKVNSIELYQTSFLQGGFFDDIEIFSLNNCNRKTLRTIKQELQKADNRIDYNRFKSYELAAYNKEIGWKDNFKDKFILSATWFSTGFDHSWLRAMVFTLLSAIIFYCLFLISEDYLNSFEVYNGKEFFSGYFRFLLITDFYNPLIEERKFLTEPLSWLVFIVGKIVIAFGIYEIIQAFRKFKT